MTIEARHLTKRFGAKTAVDDLSFTVAPGVVTGFLGPNGAGKPPATRWSTAGTLPGTGAARRRALHDVKILPLECRRRANDHKRLAGWRHMAAVGCEDGAPRMCPNEWDNPALLTRTDA